MTRLRVAFYALYVVLGAIIVVRLLSAGLHSEAISGLILGAALIALGVYRLSMYVRARGHRTR